MKERIDETGGGMYICASGIILLSISFRASFIRHARKGREKMRYSEFIVTWDAVPPTASGQIRKLLLQGQTQRERKAYSRKRPIGNYLDRGVFLI